jgi:hypothetical protein
MMEVHVIKIMDLNVTYKQEYCAQHQMELTCFLERIVFQQTIKHAIKILAHFATILTCSIGVIYWTPLIIASHKMV